MSADWPKVALNEILQPTERREEVVPGKVYRQIGVKLWGMGAYERESLDGSQTRYKTLSSVEADDVIVNKIWARNGSVAVVTENLAGCYGSNEFPTFAPIREKIMPRWFHWFTKTAGFWSQCDEKSRGTSGKNRIRPEHFLEIEIPFPPLDEQRRIVARIEELAARIDEAQKLRRQAAEEAEALLGSMTKHFFELDGAKHLLTTLDKITTRITKGESPTWQGFSYQDYGTLFIRSENVLWGKLDLSKQMHIPEAFHQKLLRSQLQKRDVLINLVGASIGRACAIPDNIGDANINQAVAVISPNLNKLDCGYLMQFLISVPTQEIIHGGKVETARPNISLGDLRKLVIPVPPLDEQRRIVAHLDELQAKVDALKEYQARTGQELDALLPSVLDRGFKGEL